MNKYFAFGMVLQSDFKIAQLLPADDGKKPDVRIVRRTLDGYGTEKGGPSVRKNEIMFSAGAVGKFRVTNGNTMEIEPGENCPEHLLGAYIMGSGMGAVLHQRGFCPIHGSCVTDGKDAVLFIGDSGAGKSTIASEFMSNGWKFVTDDVAAVTDAETAAPLVQSSYPSQKLWQDTAERYERSGSGIHSLYMRQDREKFGVDVSEFFFDGCCRITMIVLLVRTDGPCQIGRIEGAAKIDQLIRNTYRIYMIAEEDRERHFRRCAALAGNVPMTAAARQKDVPCADRLYELIIKKIGEINHG